MDIRTVVAVIRGEEDLDRVVAASADLVRRTNGHVIGVHAEPSPAA